VLASHGERPASQARGVYASPYESDAERGSTDVYQYAHDEPVATAAFESKVSQLQRKHSDRSMASPPTGASRQPASNHNNNNSAHRNSSTLRT
jgi:hypothetical protein